MRTLRGITIVRGRLAAQSALHGALARVRTIGLELLDVRQVAEDDPDATTDRAG